MRKRRSGEREVRTVRRRRGFRKRRGIETVVGRGEIGDCSSGSLDDRSAKFVQREVKHIVLLSTAKASKGNVLSMLLEDEGARARNDDKREQLAKSLDIPLTIIRPVNVVDEPNRGKMMTFSKEEGRLSGTISIEDVAVCAVRALAQPPKKGGGVFAFEIATSNETVRRIGKGNLRC